MATIKDHVQVLTSDQTLLPGNEPTFALPKHAATHEFAGGDEVIHDNLTGAGTNSHAQIDSFMTAHASRHERGGADPVNLEAGDIDMDALGVYGFPNLTDTTIAFNDSTYQFTLGDAGGGWSYWRDGVEYVMSGDQTVVLPGSPPAAGLWYIYIDSTIGTLAASQSGWTLSDTKVPVALVDWDSTATPKYHLANERHQSIFPRRVHWMHHYSEGTEVKSGGQVSGYTVTPASPVDTDNTFGISATELMDEDLYHSLAALADPAGTGTDYLVYFRTGASTWTWEQSGVPFRYTAAGYIQYDNSGTMTQGIGNKYYNWYLCLTNYEGQGRYLLVPGNSEFSALAGARGEEISDLDLSGFDPQELVFAWQFTWATSAAYSTKGKCRLAGEPVALNVARVQAGTSGGSIDHSTLANLQGGDGVDNYTHLTTDVNGVVYIGTGTPSYATSSGSLYVQGKGEIAGDLWAYSLKIQNNARISGLDSLNLGSIRFRNTNQTVNTTTLEVGALSNHFIICQTADAGFNFAHPQAQDPTLIIHSRNQSTSEYLSLYNDGTDSFLESGNGVQIKSAANGDIAQIAHGTGDLQMWFNTSYIGMDIDGATGIHRFPYTSYIAATSDAGTQSISSGGTGTTVVFEDQVTDNQETLLTGEYDNTTGVFTATLDGWYEASWGVGLDNVAWAAGDQVITYLSYNNTSSLSSALNRRGHRWYCQTAGTYAPDSGGSAGMYLSAGNTLRVKVYHDRGTATTLSSNAQVNHFSVVKVA
jgi:hypothetical protein